MSYEVEKFVKSKQEDYDDTRVEFDAEAFRQQRVNSDAGQAVQEFLGIPETAFPLEHPKLRSLSEVEVERHNAYAWIRPDADACEVCGKKAFATPVEGFVVRECTRCARLICEDHADTDADCDQDGYFMTEWVCAGVARADCERKEAELTTY